MKIFMCGKCISWFDTTGELKAHICAVEIQKREKAEKLVKEKLEVAESVTKAVVNAKIKAEDAITDSVAAGVNIIIPKTILDDADDIVDNFDEIPLELEEEVPPREALMAEAKSFGIDGRTLKNKTDEEVLEIIKEARIN